MKIRFWFRLGLFSIVTLYLLSLTQCFNMRYFKKHNPQWTQFMQYRKLEAKKRGEGYGVDHRFLPLSQISQSVLRAVLIAEDSNFYSHRGFDTEAIWEGLKTNFRSGKVRFGGSTISQQLAKNLFLYPKRSWWRKAQEAMLTWRMEHALSKGRILELYLNSIEWGYGIFGVEAAAQHYFQIPASQLDDHQAAFLAALIQSPLSYNPEKPNDYFTRRSENIYAIMNPPPVEERQAASSETPAKPNFQISENP